jgi:hypothetical protein
LENEKNIDAGFCFLQFALDGHKLPDNFTDLLK